VAIISLDSILIVLFTLVQRRITRLVLASSTNRYLRIGIFAFDAFAASAYLFTFPTVIALAPIPVQWCMSLGAASLAYFMTATVAVGIHFAIGVARRMFREDMDPSRRRVLNTATNALMAAPFVAMGYGSLVQRTNFGVKEVDLPVAGLHPDLENLRILHLSDIHLSAFLSENEFARVVDASVELRPNLAVITGDLISGPRDPLDACIRQLARLKADAGVFGCMGNHERFARSEDYTERACVRHGIRFLRLQSEPLKFGSAEVNLVGCDFVSFRERKHYLSAGTAGLVRPGTLNVLLQHNPDVFPVAAQQGYNLLLAGHTHGGQVTVEILEQWINPARFFTPFVYGVYREENASAYVTRGIGTIGVPARIGAPPEISLLRLRKA
jgi:predicted MPP superfamily phosphohydrolase